MQNYETIQYYISKTSASCRLTNTNPQLQSNAMPFPASQERL